MRFPRSDCDHDRALLSRRRVRAAANMKPTRSILDPTFHYVSSAQTDLRKTFARIKREMRKEAEAQRSADEKLRTAVVRLMKSKGAK